MEEIRCPMCGRQNPADRDVCQYCEARLKPLTGPLAEDESGAQDEDWLGSLRSEGDMSDEGQSDWSEEDFREESDHQRDPLDWLSNIEQQTGSPPGGIDAQPPDETIAARAEYQPDSEPEKEQVDLAAWLASLDEEDEEQAHESQEPPAEGGRDWLREFTSGQQASPAQEQDDDVPDWLAGLGSASETDSPQEEQPEEELFAGGLGTPSRPDEEEDLPEWLTGMDDTPSPPAPTTDKEQEELPAADEEPTPGEEEPALPEWLQEGAAAEVEEPALEAELPDWLGEIDSEPPLFEADEVQPQAEAASAAEEPAEQPDVEAEDAGDLPETVEPRREWEWETLEDPSEQQVPAAEPLDRTGELDELSDEERAEIEESAPEPVEEEALEAGELPDWLADMGPQDELDQADELPESDLPAPTQETAEWLSGLASEVESGQSPDETQEPELDLPFTFEGSADELSELDLTEEPDWLSELEEQAGEQAAEREGDDIARADLPVWLAAMRPVDSIVTPRAVPQETGMDVESAGPLSGLHDVLPAEPEVFQISKPEIQSLKLNVSEGQQKHISMLNQMLREDPEPTLVVEQEGRALQRLLRWLIAAVLLVAVLFGLFSGFSIAELPVAAPEVQAVNQAIGALPAQAPVLVAFDYEPGISGEMTPVAEALLDHLMQRGVVLTLVSTTPTGPILGEGVIQQLQQRHSYGRGAQYINLGFIPGGPTGLQSFSSLPLPYLLTYTFSGYQAWEPRLAPLSGIELVTDYALLLVLTDRQETARAWIEQVGPVLQATPMLFGTSAQIEPIIRPYYAGAPNLVDGFVAGIAGSGAYEQLIGVSGWSSSNWDVYTLLVLVAAAVVVLGGLVNLILGSRSQSSKSEGEAER